MKKFKTVSSNVNSYILAGGFYYAGYSAVNTFLSLLIASKVSGGRLDIVGYAVAYYMLVRALFEIPMSRWTESFSFAKKRNLIGVGYIIYGFFIFLLGYSTEIWHIFFLQTFIGLIDATLYPVKWTIFAKIVDRGNEELEWGLEDVASTFLPAIFTALAGIISVRLGLTYAFWLFATLLVVSGGLFLHIKPKPTTHQLREE